MTFALFQGGCGVQQGDPTIPNHSGRQGHGDLDNTRPDLIISDVATLQSAAVTPLTSQNVPVVFDEPEIAMNGKITSDAESNTDSARSSATSLFSLWRTNPHEELMSEIPPCARVSLASSMVESSPEDSQLDFRVRMVNFKSVSDYVSAFNAYKRTWIRARTSCESFPKSLNLDACGAETVFVVDIIPISVIQGVPEYRAIAPGRNKVTVKFFNITRDSNLFDRAAAEVAALSILGGTVGPYLFDMSTLSSCIGLAHSYHGYHNLMDLRGVSSLPSTRLLLRLAARGLELIRLMHKAGIVHGSINVNTLRYRRTPKTGSDDEVVSSLRLVDFWISSRLYVDSSTRRLSSGTPTDILYQPLSYLSIYQLETLDNGQVGIASRRDDLLGFAESLLMLSLGDAGIFDSNNNAVEILNRKRNLGFNAPGRVDPRIYTLYKRAREMEPNSVPNYDQLITLVRV